MKQLLTLPSLYQIAFNLGEQIEVFLEEEEKWCDFMLLENNTNRKVRIIGDNKILQDIKNIINSTLEQIVFNDVNYMIPKKAKETGSIIFLFNNNGVSSFIKIKKNGDFEELDFFSEDVIKIKNGELTHYFGKNIELDFNLIIIY